MKQRKSVDTKVGSWKESERLAVFFDGPTKTQKTEFINIMIQFGTLLAVMEKYGGYQRALWIIIYQKCERCR